MRPVLLLVVLAACGPKSPTPEATAAAPEPAPAESEKVEPAPVAATAPTPFTADEIREACPPGRKILIRLSSAEGVLWQRTHFVGGDEITAEMEGAVWPEGTEPTEILKTTESWEVLRDHAAFPADKTTITEGVEVNVPAGAFTTVRYDVIDDSGMVQHFFFAPELAGPPVKAVFADATGETVMEMVENSVEAAAGEASEADGEEASAE